MKRLDSTSDVRDTYQSKFEKKVIFKTVKIFLKTLRTTKIMAINNSAF
jgi:hypothetical protein